MYDPQAWMAEEYHQNLIKRAEKERLIKQIRLARKQPAPIYRHPLAAVGRRLSAWGEQLQARYGDSGYSMSPDGAGIR